MLPELGVQWLCASSYNKREGMQHDDGGKSGEKKKKDPFLQLMAMGMAERRTHLLRTKAAFNTHFSPWLCKKTAGDYMSDRGGK